MPAAASGKAAVSLVNGIAHRAIAVQVPADGVQLLQILDLDQAIIVAVVVGRGLGGHTREEQ